MTPRIRRVCVFGAGTMGGGIAAHLANLGFEVVLVDQTEESCRSAFERTRQARPPHFLLPSTAETIRLTGLDEGLDAARTADWVLEAIIEKPEAKRQLYVRLEPVLRAEAFISTNTSGLEIGMLKEGFSDSFRRRFLGTHFFNPPRHLKLLELIPTEETAPEVVASMTRLLEDQVARRVVPAKDTPGFIANRFGMWSMFRATHVAERLDMTIEEVDAITGPFLGRPKTGSFRLNDVVGLDIMADIAANLLVRCQADSHTGTLRNPRSLQTLLDRGWIGNKAGQGYTRKEGREFLSLDLKTCSYRNRIEPELPLLAEIGRLPLAERIGRALDSPDRVGDFLREYLVPTLRYAEAVREEISHNVLDFDRVMQWGFGWQMGPFALIDALGPERLDLPPRQNFGAGTLFLHTGQEVPLPAEPEYRTHADFPIVDEGDGLRFRDLGDGVTWLAVTRKMGTWSPESVSALASRLESAPPARLVLGGEDRVFSAGFDLRFFLEAIEAKDWAAIDSAILAFQNLGKALRRITSVAALQGVCLGGGLEMAAGCTRIVASPETMIGLPEGSVGLVPGGGGTVLMRLRTQQNARRMAESIVALAEGWTADNAESARLAGLLRSCDLTARHPDRLLAEAKALALSVQPEPLPDWAPLPGPVAGMADDLIAKARKSGSMTDHTAFIAGQIKDVFVKSADLDDAFRRERQAFLTLCQEGLTLARIRHMLDNGRPLKN